MKQDKSNITFYKKKKVTTSIEKNIHVNLLILFQSWSFLSMHKDVKFNQKEKGCSKSYKIKKKYENFLYLLEKKKITLSWKKLGMFQENIGQNTLKNVLQVFFYACQVKLVIWESFSSRNIFVETGY